jgi:hypothetical protein
MSDPRNVARDKTVAQEKKKHGEKIAPGAAETPQPGKKRAPADGVDRCNRQNAPKHSRHIAAYRLKGGVSVVADVALQCSEQRTLTERWKLHAIFTIVFLLHDGGGFGFDGTTRRR